MNRIQKVPSKFGVFEPIVAMMRPPTASEYAGTAFREWSTKTQRPVNPAVIAQALAAWARSRPPAAYPMPAPMTRLRTNSPMMIAQLGSSSTGLRTKDITTPTTAVPIVA